jgi:hypothetical protein
MKKIFIALVGMVTIISCSNNSGESGVQNDGFKGAGDPNGGLSDSTRIDPAIDSAKGEDRVDTWKRDSSR